jgi:hypothetical protein
MLPWAPATDGLRNLTGRVLPDGRAEIYAITSTVSGGGDTGADPNQLVGMADEISNTDPNSVGPEKFTVIRQGGFAEVLRGISFSPGTVLPSPVN